MHTVSIDALDHRRAALVEMAGHDPVRITGPGGEDLVLLSFRAYDRFLRMEECVSRAANIAMTPTA